MNTKFQIQFTLKNFDDDSITVTKDITLDEISKFADLCKTINKNANNQNWNWFNRLPDRWDGNKYVLDTWGICYKMKKMFDYEVEDVNLVKEFFTRFTPRGADYIGDIKFYKVEEFSL